MKVRLFESKIIEAGKLKDLQREIQFASMYAKVLKSRGLSVGPPSLNLPKGVYYQAVSAGKVRIGPLKVQKQGNKVVIKDFNAVVEPPLEGEPNHAVAEFNGEIKVYLAYEIGQAIVGVDVGVRRLITVVAIEEKSKRFLAKKFFGESLISEDMARVLSSPQGVTAINEVRKKASSVVKQAVDFIESLDPKVVALEDLREIDNRIAGTLKVIVDELVKELYSRGIKYRVLSASGTSRVCSRCGFRGGELMGSLFVCPKCGFKEDRDVNAATNLALKCYYEC